MKDLWRRLWFLLNRSRFERELREEMEAHRAMKGELGPPFGNILRLRDEAVDAWGWRWLERFLQDLRFACRLLWRAPAFTLTAVAVLSLGVGVNLAAFQVFDRLALSMRPVPNPETLVRLYRRSPRSTTTTFSYPAFDYYRQHRSRLSSAMALMRTSVAVGDAEDRRVDARFVTGNYFAEMGARPLVGRLLDPADERGDAPPVAVISEDLWRSALGGDERALSRPLRVNGRPFEVVGVVPRTFVGLDESAPSLWVPVSHHGAAFPGSTLRSDWSGGAVDFYARVPADIPIAAMEAELRATVDALRVERPDQVFDGEWLEIRGAGRLVSLDEAAPAFALIGALVGLVLVAACMNLGLLVLARTLVRDREFAIRLAVGATRSRLVRQLLTEHLLLGLLGAAVGCLVAMPAAAAVFRLTGSSPSLTPQFNYLTAVIATLLAVLSSIVFGFAPVWQTLRPVSERRLRMRSVLLAAQVTTAIALLVVSGLLVRGVTRIVRVPLGFEYQQTLVADPGLANHGVSDAAEDYWRRAESRIRQQAGIQNSALSSLAPLGNRVTVNRERTVFYDVTPSYFDTLRIAVLRGRIFDAGEPGVAVISQGLANRRWPGEDALGKTYDGDTIVGVVSDARTVRLNEGAATEYYRPIQPKDMPGAVLIVRVEGAPQRFTNGIRATLQAEDPRLTPEVFALQDALATKLAGPRQAAQLVSLLGACALLLAVTGFGGMVAFTVSERLKEIGIRLALGAHPRHVLGAVLRQFRTPVLLGTVAGSLLATAAGLVLAQELYGVSSVDPIAHVGAFVLLATGASLAAIPSVRRALRVDPVQTLRHE